MLGSSRWALAVAAGLCVGYAGALQVGSTGSSRVGGVSADPQIAPAPALSRRGLLRSAAYTTGAAALSNLILRPPAAYAMTSNPVPDGVNLEELPTGAQSAYRQYWPAMQLAGDYYTFELL